jgi:hypothetical protein
MKLLHTFLIVFCGCQLVTAQLQSFEPTADISGKEFGTEVAMTSNDILVSSISSISSPGKVYLFNTNLEQVQSFYPADALMDDRFGSTFSINNNFIAIGAPYHDSVTENTGAVYLYKKNGTTYDFLQKITAADAMPGDYFGSMVKIQNGFLYIIANSDEADGETIDTYRGSVYVYIFNGSEWVFSQKLTGMNQPEIGFNGTLVEFIVIADDHLTLIGSCFNNYYQLINNDWVFQNSYQRDCMMLGDLPVIVDVDYCENQYFDMYYVVGGGPIDLGISNPDQYIGLPEIFDSQNDELHFSNITVNNGNLFVSNIWNPDPNQHMKYPVAYYKKVETLWEFQSMIYGNGPEGMNDLFGSSIATFGGKAVFGAPKEGTGKAYFASEAALKTESFNKNTMEVFPNPVHDILKIKNDIGDISNVEVYSITGKLLLSIGNNPKEINLENFDAGMYFVKITTNDGTNQSFKIIKI